MLFTDTSELQLYFPVDNDFSIERLQPFLQDAEDNYIAKVLGEAQLSALQAAYDGNSLSADQENLLAAVRKAEIKLALYAAAPAIKLRWNDGGIQKLESADYSNAEAGDIYYARVQLLIDGYRALDALYKFLFDNKASFALWTASTAYTAFTSYFLNTSEKFGQHVAACKNRWLFAQLVPEMDIVEQIYLKGALTETFWNTLKANFADESLTAEETIVVSKAEKVIALLTYSKALTDPTIRETLRIANAASAEDLSNKGTSTADYKNEYARLAELKQNEANSLLQQLIVYLNATASDTLLTDWYNSTKYKAPATTDPKIQHFNNDSSTSTFAML